MVIVLFLQSYDCVAAMSWNISLKRKGWCWGGIPHQTHGAPFTNQPGFPIILGHLAPGASTVWMGQMSWLGAGDVQGYWGAHAGTDRRTDGCGQMYWGHWGTWRLALICVLARKVFSSQGGWLIGRLLLHELYYFQRSIQTKFCSKNMSALNF